MPRGSNNAFFDNAARKLKLGEGDTLFAYVYLDPLDPPKEIMLQWHTGGAWSHRAYWGENLIPWGKDGTPERLRSGDLPPTGKWVRLEVEAKKLGLKPGTQIDGWAFTQQEGTAYWDQRRDRDMDATGRPGLQLAHRLDPGPAGGWRRGAAGKPQGHSQAGSAKRTKAERRSCWSGSSSMITSRTRAVFEPLHAQLAQVEKERKQVEEKIPTTLVFREKGGEPKPAFILNRGEYDQRRDKVGRATPAFLSPLPPGAPVNRLGLARWLIAPDHPLTARVAANRFWLQVFGTGIVKTAEDFGSQGEPPSHPELLDWLAVQFREDGWDVKRFMKRLVMSATYRQSSRITPQSLAKDPANRLLSRGPAVPARRRDAARPGSFAQRTPG